MADEAAKSGRAITRSLGGVAALAGVVLWLLAVYLLSQSVQNSARFSDLLPWILIINAAGLAVLITLIIIRLVQLVRAWKQRVTGSRLEARVVWMSGLLATLPILFVFYFSVQFINHGIDSWFGAEIGDGLNNALKLSRAALDLRSREYLNRTKIVADVITLRGDLTAKELNEQRRNMGAIELTVMRTDGRVQWLSSDSMNRVAEFPPTSEMLLQVQRGQTHVSLDPIGTGNYLVHVAVPIRTSIFNADRRALMATFPLERRIAELADVVDGAARQYAELTRSREPLKRGFVLTLILVLAVSVLGAIYGAFWVARRLVKPIESLVAGTRAVARGDFGTQLPQTSHDEMGVLVHSFNDMTRRLSRAREEAAKSQQVVETERANLAVILARLSSGVISLSADYTVRVFNAAAEAMLHAETDAGPQPFTTESPAATASPLYAQFVTACRKHLDAGEHEWREQITLNTESTQRVLICACTGLPGDTNAEGASANPAGGYLIVFDDITALLQAQREAAWGEVARRLAHEIKNPLTPIRLSAERLRHKLLPTLNTGDAETLERATHTIVQQVDSMKDMVNAFSQYARAPHMRVQPFSLNDLVTGLVELYRTQNPALSLQVVLDKDLPQIQADQDRLRQVLHNLIANSLEALESISAGVVQGKVQITTSLLQRGNDPWVELCVSDTGPGFTADMLGRIFEPYVTSKLKGSGLGLAIVKKIVEEHGGKIEAENRSEGGARVRIQLPLTLPERMTPNNERRREQDRRKSA
ncbi:MAG TPA: ATP-binding protein [Steroidobacteraceae bacterium]|nr:ATP-binding protein [Steroidobacteraceae bacterium]